MAKNKFFTLAGKTQSNETLNTYDSNGNLIAVTAKRVENTIEYDQKTAYKYDSFDRLIQTEYPDTSKEELFYDNNSNIVWNKTRNGDEFYYEYDAMNKLTGKYYTNSSNVNLIPEGDSDSNWSESQDGTYLICNNGATRTYDLPSLSGRYVILMKWAQGAEADDVQVDIEYASGNTYTTYIDQTQNGDKWNGIVYVDIQHTNPAITIYSQSGKTTYADDIKIVPATQYYYDIAGRLLRINDSGKLTDYAYGDNYNRLTDVIDTDSRSVGYSYDKLSRPEMLVYPDGSCLVYAYDELSRLTDIKYGEDAQYPGNAIVIAHYDYDEFSRRTDLYYNYDGGDSIYDELGDGHVAYLYEDVDEDGYIVHDSGNYDTSILLIGSNVYDISHDLNNDGFTEFNLTYGYDNVGNVKSKNFNGLSERSYQYDKIYQLLEDDGTDDDGNIRDWEYDSLGNWAKYRLNSVLQTEYTLCNNELNQYYSDGTEIFGYDNSGNLTGDNSRIFVYDQLNRLVEAQSGPWSTVFVYDAVGHRISKEVSQNSTVTSYIEYCYSGDRVIAEYEDLDSDSFCDDLARKYIYGPGIDEPICMIVYDASGIESGRYFYHQDALGSVIALSKYDSTAGFASVVEKYEYTPFGMTTIYSPGTNGIWGDSDDLDDLTVSDYGNPYLFTGRRWDQETSKWDSSSASWINGTALYHYRARGYSPEFGRFLQPDPIGYSDGMNMYAYVGNNPVGFVDPMGLCKGDKWDDMSWSDKLGNGYYYGTGHAEDAFDYWVGKMVENPDNPVYAGMGTLAGLWQPDNFKKNGLSIAMLGGSRLIGKGLGWAGNALKGLRGGVGKIPVGTEFGKLGKVVQNISGKVTGFRGHGLNQTINRGVSPKAILNSVKNPKVVLEQSSGNMVFLSDDAAVVLNNSGKVVTTYPASMFDDTINTILNIVR